MVEYVVRFPPGEYEKLKFCTRCEILRPKMVFKKHRCICNICLNKENKENEKYKNFEDLPYNLQNRISYLTTVGESRINISRKCKLSYTALQKFSTYDQIPVWTKAFQVDYTIDDRTKWCIGFRSMTPKLQYQISKILEGKVKLFRDRDPETYKEISKQCSEIGVPIQIINSFCKQVLRYIPSPDEWKASTKNLDPKNYRIVLESFGELKPKKQKKPRKL